MMTPPKQAVILCGGLGTRLKPFTDKAPKPMVLVNGRPFLEHLLQQVSHRGVRRFLLLTGYLGDQIRQYFGDGSSRGWEVEYSEGPVDWDTGRRLWEARQKIENRFLLLYSDNFVQFSMDRLMGLHQSKKALLSLLLAPKAQGNIRVSSDGSVDAYDKTRSSHDLNFVDVGYMIVERDPVFEVFSSFKNHPNISFSEVLRHLADSHKLAGLVVKDPYHSISDPERLELMRAYIKPKYILLIDRDGVINQKASRGEYVSSWRDFKWIPETRQAMRDLAANGFQFIVLSNQAGIARGMINPIELEQIHKNMVSELQKDGVNILKIYVCPHHWDEKCDCRKPFPGLFFQASQEYKLRMDRTIFVGDDPRDSTAAYNAGCHSILVGDGQTDGTNLNKKSEFSAETLLDAVPWICNKFQEWEGQNSHDSIST